ncbi:hypothetical protein Plhal304r1_c035g0109701 [Plasmopara halstedii]
MSSYTRAFENHFKSERLLDRQKNLRASLQNRCSCVRAHRCLTF